MGAQPGTGAVTMLESTPEDVDVDLENVSSSSSSEFFRGMPTGGGHYNSLRCVRSGVKEQLRKFEEDDRTPEVERKVRGASKP